MAKAPWEKEQAPAVDQQTTAAPVAPVVNAETPPPPPPAPTVEPAGVPLVEQKEAPALLPELDPARQAPLALINLVSQGVPMAEAKKRLGLS